MGQQGLICCKKATSQKRIRTIKQLNCFYLNFFYLALKLQKISLRIQWIVISIIHFIYSFTLLIYKHTSDCIIIVARRRRRTENTKKHQLRGKMMSWFTSFSVKFKTQDNSYPLFVFFSYSFVGVLHYLYQFYARMCVACHATYQRKWKIIYNAMTFNVCLCVAVEKVYGKQYYV